MKFATLLTALIFLAPSLASAEVKYDQHVKVKNSTGHELRLEIYHGNRPRKGQRNRHNIKAGKSQNFKFNDLKEKFGKKTCKKKCKPKSWTKDFTLVLERAGDREFGGRNGCVFTMAYSSNKKHSKVKSRNLGTNKCNGTNVHLKADGGKTINVELTGTGL